MRLATLVLLAVVGCRNECSDPSVHIPKRWCVNGEFVATSERFRLESSSGWNFQPNGCVLFGEYGHMEFGMHQSGRITGRFCVEDRAHLIVEECKP